MVRCAPSARVPTSMTVVTGCVLSNRNSQPTRTRMAPPFLDRARRLDGRPSCPARHQRSQVSRAPCLPAHRRTRRMGAVDATVNSFVLIMQILSTTEDNTGEFLQLCHRKYANFANLRTQQSCLHPDTSPVAPERAKAHFRT